MKSPDELTVSVSLDNEARFGGLEFITQLVVFEQCKPPRHTLRKLTRRRDLRFVASISGDVQARTLFRRRALLPADAPGSNCPPKRRRPPRPPRSGD